MGAMIGTAGLAGTLGYANYDQEFRKQVEQTIPGAEDVFNVLLGEKALIAETKSVVQRPVKIQKLKVLRENRDESVAKGEVTTPSKLPLKVMEEPQKKKETDEKKEEPEKNEDS